MPPDSRRGPWSQSEDQYLLSIVTQQGPNNWVRISQMLRSRTPKQCRERYHQNLKPSLNHDPITAEEGLLIEQLVATMGRKWAEIARRLNGRSDNAVKNWWNGSQNRKRRQSDRRHSDAQPVTTDHHHHVGLFHHHHRHSECQTCHQPQYTSRPALSIQSQPYNPRAYETPIHSPSCQSVLSTDGAPSLVTDSGSESRSPLYAASPMDRFSLPHTRSHDYSRRRSSLLSHQQNCDADQPPLHPLRVPYADQLRATVREREQRRLPKPLALSNNVTSSVFHEPIYGSTGRQHYPHLATPHSVCAPRAPAPYPAQKTLPSFSEIALPRTNDLSLILN